MAPNSGIIRLLVPALDVDSESRNRLTSLGIISSIPEYPPLRSAVRRYVARSRDTILGVSRDPSKTPPSQTPNPALCARPRHPSPFSTHPILYFWFRITAKFSRLNARLYRGLWNESTDSSDSLIGEETPLLTLSLTLPEFKRKRPEFLPLSLPQGETLV
jgi:hypothetical protein